MACFTPQVIGILEVDAVDQGSQLRLCGRWGAADASAHLVSRWVDELQPLWSRTHHAIATKKPSADHEVQAAAAEVIAADLERLAMQLRREYERQRERK